MAEKAHQAVGVLAGRVDGDAIELISGERFPATLSPTLRQWLQKNPDAAGTVRIWLAYPRTLKDDPKLAFYLVGSPEDQTDPRWQREIDRFTIKGQVIVSRARKNNTVVWVPRNDAPPLGKRRHPDWKGRALFLSRSLRPVRRWKGADVWIEAKRVQGDLVISTYRELHHHPTQLKLENGWSVPWPFRPTRSTVTTLFKEALLGEGSKYLGLLPRRNFYGFDADGKPVRPDTWVKQNDFRPALRKTLRQFNQLQKLRATVLLPKQAQFEGQPMTEREIAREADQAERWGKFFTAICNFLDSLEPGQLVAMGTRADPALALMTPVINQAGLWFQMERTENDGWKVWFEGAPVPNKVKRAAIALLGPSIIQREQRRKKAEESHAKVKAVIKQVQKTEAKKRAKADRTPSFESIRDYFHSQGAPTSYTTPRMLAAWKVQTMVAAGKTDEQICTYGWMTTDLLAELKRVELPIPVGERVGSKL